MPTSIDGALPLADPEPPTSGALRLRDQAIAASSSGIVIADVRQPDMPLIYVNPAFERITGYSAADVLGRNCRFLQGPETQQPALAELRAAIREARDCSVVLRNYRKDGTLFWNELHMSPVFDANNQLTHFIGVQTDITRRKLAEDALQQASDALEARVAERTQTLSQTNLVLELELNRRQAAEDESRRQAARAEALLRVAGRLNAQLDLTTVLNAICAETARALMVPAVSVGLYDVERDVIVNIASLGFSPDAAQQLPTTLRVYYADMARGQGPFIVIPDISQFNDLPDIEFFRSNGVRSLAAVGMIRAGELIGTLAIFATSAARTFAPDELQLLQGLSDQAAQAIVNARLLAQSERRLGRSQTLLQIDAAIAGSFELQPTLDAIVDGAFAGLGVDAIDILLLDVPSQMLEFAVGRGFLNPALRQTRRRMGEGNPGRAALERVTVYIADLNTTHQASGRTALLIGDHFKSYYGVPLIAKSAVLGVLEIFHRTTLAGDAEWLEFMSALAGQAAIAIDEARLFEALKHSNADLAHAYDTTLEGWSRALDLRDKETEGHSRRVTEMTLRLAREGLGLSAAELVQVQRGALLHDIGKMGIPDSILLKPDKLTEAEWSVMRRHPSYAYDLLSPIEYLRPALDIPYCHHEKWDGSGYPRGLRGEQIPLAARLFAIVDVWDALRSDRPYRAAWPEARVREHIRALGGSHFDPQLVELFLRI